MDTEGDAGSSFPTHLRILGAFHQWDFLPGRFSSKRIEIAGDIEGE
jgi:hypothetical protein